MSWLAKLHPNGTMPACKIIGNAHQVFNFIHMLATSFPMETDPDWWEVYLITIKEKGGWN